MPPGQGVDQQATAAGTLDLNFNYPALPGQAEVLRGGLRQLAAAGDLEALLRYQPHSGRSHERATVARHLACRGLQVEADQVSIVSGAQHGLATTVMALLKPGDVVATDALTYPGFKVVAEAHGVELVSIALTEHGPDLQAFERLCRSRRVRAVYAMPTLHNPMGWVLDLAWREHLVRIARQHRLLIIEDAAYAFLAENPPAPLAALAPELTVYVSGFSKNVATGLRVGFVVAPPAWVPLIERVIRATTWNTPGVMTALVCNWIDDGTVQRLEAEKRQDATARQALARRCWPAWRTSDIRRPISSGCRCPRKCAPIRWRWPCCGKTSRCPPPSLCQRRAGAPRHPPGPGLGRAGSVAGGIGKGAAGDWPIRLLKAPARQGAGACGRQTLN